MLSGISFPLLNHVIRLKSSILNKRVDEESNFSKFGSEASLLILDQANKESKETDLARSSSRNLKNIILFLQDVGTLVGEKLFEDNVPQQVKPCLQYILVFLTGSLSLKRN